MLTSGSNTDQLSNIGSMVDLTSDFPKASRGKGGAKGGAKGGVKKPRKKKTVSSDTCPPIVPKVKKNAPLKAGPRKRGVKKNQLTTDPSLPPQLTYLPSKYINDEDDLFEEDENDQHNVNHHSLTNHSLTNHSSINHSLTTGGRALWTLSSTASSTSPPDVGGEEDQEDNRDDDMIDDEDYIADDEKYYRELLLDPTLRDYHSRESSLFFDEILNTNSPFL